MTEPMTSQEAATYLRITLRTLYQLIADGFLPPQRVGKRGPYRFFQSDLDKCLKDSTEPDDSASILAHSSATSA